MKTLRGRCRTQALLRMQKRHWNNGSDDEEGDAEDVISECDGDEVDVDTEY